MLRIAGTATIAAGLALLLVSGWQASIPEPVSTGPVPRPAERARESPETGSSGDVALYQEIVSARQTALEAARDAAPLQDGGSVFAKPSSVLQKGAAKREEMVNARFAKMLTDIAQAHGRTREEVEGVYRRGQAMGWPTAP